MNPTWICLQCGQIHYADAESCYICSKVRNTKTQEGSP